MARHRHQRPCGFLCGGSIVSKEHLWPEWIGRLIQLDRRRKLSVDQTHRDFASVRTRQWFERRWPHTKIPMPCKNCNSGWMSRLESTVRPFFTPMIVSGEKTALDVIRQGQNQWDATCNVCH